MVPGKSRNGESFTIPGEPNQLIRFMAESYAHEQWSELREAIAASLIINLALSALGGFLMFLAAEVLAKNIFAIPRNDNFSGSFPGCTISVPDLDYLEQIPVTSPICRYENTKPPQLEDFEWAE